MISNELIQAAILAKIQATVSITSLLADGINGIRELNYKGTDFAYPCIRIALEGQTDIAGTNTHCPSQADFSFYIFSEKSSSKETNQIAGKVVTAFRGLSFSQSTVKFVKINILENIPAIAQDERTWRAQIRCQSTVHTA